MSIATKKGDQGETQLLYNRRVSKSHPRVEAYGTVDELNAALGVARAGMSGRRGGELLKSVQEELVRLMGELATDPRDRERFEQDGFKPVTGEMTGRLDEWIADLESKDITFKGWAMPGGTPRAAALDMARTICRRAERRTRLLDEQNELGNREILVYLNRLGDWLWLLARWDETEAERVG